MFNLNNFAADQGGFAAGGQEDLAQSRGIQMAASQYGLPLVVRGLDARAAAQSLKRVRLKTGEYSERWLQDLIMRHPSLLPIEQIEPAFIPAIPICMELNVPSGRIDNLYATPAGDLIVGETKLFRNPESRREVVGQIIDYAKDLATWTYTELDAAVRRAEPVDGSRPLGLYAKVASAVGTEGVDEARFIDAVTRNLERGRFLLLIVGDGIQEGTEGITRFLQEHAQLHFTFGLVELSIYELPGDGAPSGYLVQPRIIARTFEIDRGTYAIDAGKIVFKPPVAETGASSATPKRTTITEERFYEQLEESSPGAGPGLKAFAARLGDLKVRVEFGTGSLILRWRPTEDISWNLGSVTTAGKVWTEFLNSQADRAGLLNLSHKYQEQIAASVPGASVKRGTTPLSWYVTKGGTYVMIEDLLAHEDAWYAAVVDFTSAASVALAAS